MAAQPIGIQDTSWMAGITTDSAWLPSDPSTDARRRNKSLLHCAYDAGNPRYAEIREQLLQ